MKHWVGLIAFLLIGQVQAARPNCVELETTAERLVCIDGVLSKLDEELNAAYKAALQDKQKAATIKQAQQQWLNKRNACVDLACVESAYRTRLQELPSPPVSKQKPKPRFRVTEGKGWTVCESYVRFLNSLPQSEPPPLCHLKLSPDLKEPDWEELDIHSHLQLVYTLEKLTSPSEHDRPVDNFDHWKSIVEQQISTGEASPRLRRVRLALVEGGPVETILAYEPDRNSCDKEVKKNGYAFYGSRTSLFIWNERDHKIEEYMSQIAFGLSPRELLIFQGKPFTFWRWWGDVDGKTRYVEGRIGVKYFTNKVGSPYANLRRCQIGFELPSEITERMIK
ncbi:MAG: lysozyme inhibitor LprI family protein [Porticoccaceae bacterium]